MSSTRQLAIVCLAVVGCGTPGKARAPQPSPKYAQLAANIDERAAEALANTPTAGLAVAVTWHGEQVVAKGYGLADVEHATPVAADTVFRIASITKQFAAAAVMRLVAEHKLAVDDELVRYLPSY